MLSKELREQILDLGLQSKTVREIAEIVGVGKSTVSTILKKGSGAVAVAVAVKPVQQIPAITIEEMPLDDHELTQFMDNLGSSGPASAAKPLSDDFLDSFIAPVKTSKARATKAIKTTKPETALVVKQVEAPPDKGTLISKLTMNVNNFEVVLRDVIKGDKESFLKSLHSMSVSELTSTLKLFEHTRSSNNMANQLKYGVFVSAAALEMITKSVLRLRSDGYADMIKAQDAELTAILREMAMDSSMDGLKTLQTPGVRLATLMATTLFSVDARNRMQAPLKPDLSSQYREL